MILIRNLWKVMLELIMGYHHIVRNKVRIVIRNQYILPTDTVDCCWCLFKNWKRRMKGMEWNGINQTKKELQTTTKKRHYENVLMFFQTGCLMAKWWIKIIKIILWRNFSVKWEFFLGLILRFWFMINQKNWYDDFFRLFVKCFFLLNDNFMSYFRWIYYNCSST